MVHTIMPRRTIFQPSFPGTQHAVDIYHGNCNIICYRNLQIMGFYRKLLKGQMNASHRNQGNWEFGLGHLC